MDALEFAKSRGACQEGLDWLEARPWIKTPEEGWDLMIQEGNRFIFWMYSRCPVVTKREISVFSLKVKRALKVDDLSKIEDVSQDEVRSIMKDYPNPYRGL